MSSLQFNQDKIESFQELLQGVRQTRHLLTDDLCKRVMDLLSCFEFAEEKISSHIVFFNRDELKRRKATRDIKLLWQSIRKDRDLFLEGLKKPEWKLLYRNNNAAPIRLKWPTRLHLKRIFKDHALSISTKHRDDLKCQVAELDVISEIFKKIKKNIEALPAIVGMKETNIVNTPKCIPTWVDEKRGPLFFIRCEKVNSFVYKIKEAIKKAQLIEDEIDNLMFDFNSIGKRRHLSLAVKWNLNIKRTITLGCIQGPYWCQLLINMQRGQRNIKTIKVINRDIIRKSGFRRHEEKVLDLYKNINRLKAERSKLLTPIYHIDRILRNKSNTRG